MRKSFIKILPFHEPIPRSTPTTKWKGATKPTIKTDNVEGKMLDITTKAQSFVPPCSHHVLKATHASRPLGHMPLSYALEASPK